MVNHLDTLASSKPEDLWPVEIVLAVVGELPKARAYSLVAELNTRIEEMLRDEFPGMSIDVAQVNYGSREDAEEETDGPA